MKKCCTCKKGKPLSDFHADSTSKDKKAHRCKECACFWSRFHHARRMKEEPEYKKQKRAAYIKNQHGISLQEYENRVAQQKYACAICGVKLSTDGHNTHLDHCHKTGNLRAILCTNCNRGLGHFQDSPDLLEIAAKYLRAHNRTDDPEKEVCPQ